MKELVIQSRITPPRSPGKIIARGNLLNTLSSGSDKKLILVTAPAGYGKTTLVSNHAYSSGSRFAWYHAHKDASSPFVFFAYLIHSLSRLKPGFGAGTLETIRSLDADSGRIKDINAVIDEIVYQVASEFISAFDDRINLIIDDLHELSGNKWLGYSLNRFFEEIPHNLQVIITSRHLPDFNISHLRAKREVLELTHKHLVFTDTEIRDLSKELYSLNYTDEEVKYLESSLGGWVTGIHMLIQATNGRISSGGLSETFLPDTLFDFFAGEIFEKLDSGVKEFLLATSHFESFDSEMCNSLLDIDTSENILGMLSSKNIFIESIQVVNEKGKQVTQYNYIQLFRNFLIKKSLQLWSGEKIKSIFAKASNYYSGKNNTELSIDFAVQAGNDNYSAALVKDNFDELFKNGRFERLWNWIELLTGLCQTDKYLLYYKGLLSKYYLGRLDDALLYFDRSVSIAASDDDPDFIDDVLISRTEILLNQGKFNSAIETLNMLKTPAISKKNSARLNYNLGNAYFYIGEYSTALPYLESAAGICREHGFEELLTDVYNTMGNIYINNGEFILSTHYYELTLNRITGIYKKFVVLGNLALLYSRTGKFEKAKQYYDRTNDILKLIKTPIFEIMIKLTEYTLRYETGDFDTALAIAESINKESLQIKNLSYTFISCLLLGECSYYTGSREKAANYYKLAEKYIDEDNENDKATLKLFRIINELSPATPDKTTEEFTEVYTYLDSKNSNYDKVMAEYYLAQHYLDKGLNEPCLEYLQKALKLASEKEYNSFLIREYLRSPRLFNFAVKNNLSKGMVKNIYSSILDITALEWITTEYNKALQNRIKGFYDINMTCFGKLDFYVRGEPVAENKWIRKKRKLILSYLLLSPNYTLTKDKVIDVFFPDTPLESLDNTFHQAISNLRSALKLEAPVKKSKKTAGGTEPDYVLYEGKSLMLNQDYNYTSDAAEYDALTVKASSAECPEETRIILLKRAVDLYKGEFMAEYYEPWIENLRDEYRNKFIKYSEQLLDLLKKGNNTEELITYSQKILNIDKLNEKANILLISSYSMAGKNKSAKSAYEKMARSYKEELNEEIPADILNAVKEYITV